VVVSDQETSQSPDTGHAAGAGAWGTREAAALGRRVARRRDLLRLSAQDVAGRCARLGMSSLTRQVVSRMEHGRREAVSTSELAVLAAALEMAPVDLLLPFGAGDIEYLPGRTASPLDAARWWAGEASLGEDGSIGSERHASTAMLFEDHQTVLAELGRALESHGGTVSEAEYWRLRRRPGQPSGLSDEDRMLVMSIATLREMRSSIRALGLQPPVLQPALKWLDEPGA
jgi:transcriptional regulator with XRE-family HTH domain